MPIFFSEEPFCNAAHVGRRKGPRVPVAAAAAIFFVRVHLSNVDSDAWRYIGCITKEGA
jgi:hypothetical protein